jgi:hypothetical protein
VAIVCVSLPMCCTEDVVAMCTARAYASPSKMLRYSSHLGLCKQLCRGESSVYCCIFATLWMCQADLAGLANSLVVESAHADYLLHCLIPVEHSLLRGSMSHPAYTEGITIPHLYEVTLQIPCLPNGSRLGSK